MVFLLSQLRAQSIAPRSLWFHALPLLPHDTFDTAAGIVPETSRWQDDVKVSWLHYSTGDRPGRTMSRVMPGVTCGQPGHFQMVFFFLDLLFVFFE
jgi:hypothetical protein